MFIFLHFHICGCKLSILFEGQISLVSEQCRFGLVAFMANALTDTRSDTDLNSVILLTVGEQQTYSRLGEHPALLTSTSEIVCSI